MTLKPIETKYRGCRFRSRLEARWAVYMDTLGYDWSYEPEGFDLPSGWYLPDFRVEDAWMEVKPTFDELIVDQRWRDLARHSQSPVWIMFGMSRVGECQFWMTINPDDRILIHNKPIDAKAHPALVAALSARFEHGEAL